MPLPGRVFFTEVDILPPLSVFSVLPPDFSGSQGPRGMAKSQMEKA